MSLESCWNLSKNCLKAMEQTLCVCRTLLTWTNIITQSYMLKSVELVFSHWNDHTRLVAKFVRVYHPQLIPINIPAEVECYIDTYKLFFLGRTCMQPIVFWITKTDNGCYKFIFIGNKYYCNENQVWCISNICRMTGKYNLVLYLKISIETSTFSSKTLKNKFNSSNILKMV